MNIQPEMAALAMPVVVAVIAMSEPPVILIESSK
jgi:hypothetical protein